MLDKRVRSQLYKKPGGGIITKRHPCEEGTENVIQHLNVQEEHTDDVMSTLVHPTKVHQRIDTSGEGTVQPSTTLGDEFGSTLGHISLTLGGFNI